MFPHSHRRRTIRSRDSIDDDGNESDRSLFNLAPVGMLIIDIATWRVVRANRAAESLLGYGEDRHLAGMRVGRLITIETDQLQRLLTGSDGRASEVAVLRGDGSTGLFVVSSTAVPWAGGRRVMIALTAPVCDPGFRQHLCQEGFLEFAQELPQGVYEMDDRFVLTFMNRAGLAMFGLTTEDFNRGICVVDWAVPDERQEMIGVLNGSLEGIRTTRHEWQVRRKDGSSFPVMIYATPVVHQGRVVGNRGLLIDISEQRRSQQALEAANRKLNLLNAVTRHDIQNQVTALLGYLTLAGESGGDAGQSAYLRKSRRAAEAISRQITFTREYQEIGVRAPEWQHLGTVLARARAAWVSEKVTISVEHADIEVYADPMLEKVFSNLIDNALRYGGEISTIRFSAAATDGGYRITCADDGRGVSADQKELIFCEGFGHHTGFGLFLAREILLLTGMTIAETGIPGEGAVFTISVPDGGSRTTVQG